MTLGTNLKAARTKKGFSQNDVANFLNISRQSISRWETNKSYPDIDNLVELSKYYEVSIDELLTETKVLQKEINEKTEKMNSHIQEIEGQQHALNNIIYHTTDESWILIILTALSIAIAPFGLISVPLILWRNKKENQFYKIINLFSAFIFIYNIHVFTVWLTTALEIGVVTTIE